MKSNGTLAEQTPAVITPAVLDDLERRTIAFLYSIWRAQGVDKRIVRCAAGGHFEDIREVVENG